MLKLENKNLQQADFFQFSNNKQAIISGYQFFF